MKKITKELLKTITFVPGLIGIANVDLTKSASALPEDKWTNGITAEETSKGLKICIAIIVDADVRTKVVSNELMLSMKTVLKLNRIKMDKINIYIRGVR